MLAAAGLLVLGCGRRKPAGANGGDGGTTDVAPPSDATPTSDAAPSDAAPTSDATVDGSDRPPVVVVDPAVSRAWTWSSCGTIGQDAQDSEAMFGADGTIAVRNERGIRVYDHSGAVQPGSDGPADFLIAAPDGAVLAGRLTPSSIVLSPIGSQAARYTFAVPSGASCGMTFAFSSSGAYLLGRGHAGACVWRAADQAFVAALPLAGWDVAVRGDSLVSAESAAVQSTSVVTRDFAGHETGRVQIDGISRVLLSPAGDRLVTLAPGPARLFDLDNGTVISWTADPGSSPQVPVFTTAGDLVLFGGALFRTADGTRVMGIDPSSRKARFLEHVLALSPDGHGTVLEEFGRATLEDLAAPGIAAVLGGLPPPAPGGHQQPIDKLALSADGSLVVADIRLTAGFVLRLAPHFADSRLVSNLFGEVNVDVDISADGTMASIAGDGRALFGAADGRIIWPPPIPPPEVLGCPTEKLRLSPKKTWGAGASYDQTMAVFAIGETPGALPPEPLVRFPSACGDAAAFTRDEGLMATSTPALYRTAATAAGWQKVWSAPDPPKVSPGLLSGGGYGNDVRFSPDETQVLVSRCEEIDSCVATLLTVATGAVVSSFPDVRGPNPSFSPDGSWIVAGPTLFHLPSGDTRPLDPAAVPTTKITAALFTPEGDILAGSTDGSLTRYCRSP